MKINNENEIYITFHVFIQISPYQVIKDPCKNDVKKYK